MKKLLLLFLLLSSFSFAQQDTTIRNRVVLNAAVGVREYVTYSFGVYPLRNLTVSFKATTIMSSDVFTPTFLRGFEVKYFFSGGYFINYVSGDCLFLHQGGDYSGYSYEFTIGGLSNRDRWFGVFYELGYGVSTGKWTNYPSKESTGAFSVRVGINFNY